MTIRGSIRAVILGVVLSFIVTCPVASAQSGEELKGLSKEIESLKDFQALRKELQGVKDGQAAIHKELQEIKTLLQGKQATAERQGQAEPRDILLSTNSDDPVLGDQNAKLHFIEFTDYQCPFCGRHAKDVLPQIEKEYIKTGKLKYVLRDFPIESLHPMVFKAHEATHCAAEQGKYWEMHDRLFANQKGLDTKELASYAQTLGLDLQNFEQCLGSRKYEGKIRRDIEEGQKAGVNGTPTFFLAYTEPNDSKLKVVKVLRGAQSYAAIKQAIDRLLQGEK